MINLNNSYLDLWGICVHFYVSLCTCVFCVLCLHVCLGSYIVFPIPNCLIDKWKIVQITTVTLAQIPFSAHDLSI
jgi:hypothetical protein